MEEQEEKYPLLIKIVVYILTFLLSIIPIINLLVILNFAGWRLLAKNDEQKLVSQKLFLFALILTVLFMGVLTITFGEYAKYLYKQGADENFQIKKEEPKKTIDRATLQLNKICTAVEMYYTKNLSYPEKLEDLVPDFIDSIPQDPAANKPFTYVTDKQATFTISAPIPSKYGMEKLEINENGELIAQEK